MSANTDPQRQEAVSPQMLRSGYLQRWLKTPGLKGQQHQDTPMRKFGDNEYKYLNKWELLGLT